ncbi:caspase family protein [Azospirillum sp. 11R-A]
MGRKRAAVVIGVNKTGGGLTPLQACVDGANDVAEWLRGENFDRLDVFTDEDESGAQREVTAKMLKTAVKDIVKSRLYSQLVIFFSGHGSLKNRDEFWLLSGAPEDSEEAISWTETFELAKECGIPNVVLISDACRTKPTTLQAMRIRGSVLLPNQAELGPTGQVDKFLATTLDRPAYEVLLTADGKKISVFTHCLLEAFSRPKADMVDTVTEDGETIRVVTNRKLGSHLKSRVPELIQSINPIYEQMPDTEVLSDAYIGKAGAVEMPGPDILGSLLRVITTVRVLVGVIIGSPWTTTTMSHGGLPEQSSPIAVQFSEFAFEAETGLVVHGARIDDIFISHKARAMILQHGDTPGTGLVTLDIPEGVASVAIRFRNGHGTVIAGLRGYIAHVTVEGRAVTDVSYLPSPNSDRWTSYLARSFELEMLREKTAMEALEGVFRLSDPHEAEAFARTARMEKRIDPALGLYAAYAYSQASNQTAIESIQQYMQHDLGACLFDVALLAKGVRMPEDGGPTLVPFCPMLTQGWNQLRLRKVVLPRVVADAQDELEESLWTVFTPERFDKIVTEMTADGRLR